MYLLVGANRKLTVVLESPIGTSLLVDVAPCPPNNCGILRHCLILDKTTLGDIEIERGVANSADGCRLENQQPIWHKGQHLFAYRNEGHLDVSLDEGRCAGDQANLLALNHPTGSRMIFSVAHF